MNKKLRESDKPDGDQRTPYEGDKARIIHSASFRRLKGKTQITGATEGDFHRTRLTHSLEVAQIASGLVAKIQRELPIDDQLTPYIRTCNSEKSSNDFYTIIESACYAHDLGHPPFGHSGEIALNKLMQDHGNDKDYFEGNAQTLRILSKLEKYKPEGYGINPTRRLLFAILKYPVAAEVLRNNGIKPPKCYYASESGIVEWMLKDFSQRDKELFQSVEILGDTKKAKFKSFDASVMECADDIANATHDFEDMISRGTISYQKFKKYCGEFYLDELIEFKSKTIDDLYYDSYERKTIISRMVGVMISDVEIIDLNETKNVDFTHPLLRYNLKFKEKSQNIRKFYKAILDTIIKQPEIQMLERKGQYIINEIFKEIEKDPAKLIYHWELYTEGTNKRKICDYIAGMTDEYAGKIYERLFIPGKGTSHDEL